MSFRPYERCKDSGVDGLSDVPAHWTISRLGYEAWVRARLGWKGLKAQEYVEDGFVLLATPNIKGTDIDFDDVNYINEHRYNESPEIIVQVGDVLLAKDGSTLGTVNIVRQLPKPTTVNSSIAVISPGERLQSGFLYYLFRSSYIEHTIQQLKGGMGVPHLFQDDLTKFHLPLPPLDEQSTVASFLDHETAKIDALVDGQRRLIELLKEKRQAVISHAVTKGLDPTAPLKDSGVEWLGQVPEHWEVVRVKWVAQTESGHTPDKKIASYWENCTIPWVSLHDTKYLKDNDYISETAQYVNEKGIANSSARILPEGAVVFSRDATIGRCGITNLPMAVSQHFIAWICGDAIVPEFLLRCLRAMGGELERLTFGATVKTIGMEDVSRLTVALPPVPEQAAIVEHIRQSNMKLDALIGAAENAIALLQERRTALISAAVTGKIDVRGAAPAAAEAA